jgi:hypothetical protein
VCHIHRILGSIQELAQRDVELETELVLCHTLPLCINVVHDLGAQTPVSCVLYDADGLF